MLRSNYTNRMLADVLNHMLETEVENKTYSNPAVNVAERKEDYIIEIAAPGLSKEQLKIELNKDSLIVYAEEMKNEEQNYIKREFNFGNFRKIYHVPEKVNREKISAKYADGIFTITLPKREEAIDRGPVQIAIS